MSYFTSRRTGDIQRRLDGARQVRQFAVGSGIGALLALVQLDRRAHSDGALQPVADAAFLATTPLYGGLMFFSRKVLRPLFAGVEESQGKYSSHQIDAIKGIEAVKAAAAENVFRDAMLNEFLSVSRKIFRSSFIVMSYDSVLQTIGMLSTAIFLWVGANQVMRGRSHHRRLRRLQLADRDGLRRNHANARRLGQHAIRVGPAESAQRHFRTGTRTGPRSLAPHAGPQLGRPHRIARRGLQIWRAGSARIF